jgi:hypothetical protein
MILCLSGRWRKSSNFNENLTSSAYLRLPGASLPRVIGLNFAAFHAKICGIAKLIRMRGCVLRSARVQPG